LISLHMLVLDEEELLPPLIEHVRPYVAEMIVMVDDRTTDRRRSRGCFRSMPMNGPKIAC
jgi:hypothetical protein